MAEILVKHVTNLIPFFRSSTALLTALLDISWPSFSDSGRTFLFFF